MTLNPNPKLAELEEYVLESANKLGIGTMGFGGEVTLLGCKIGVMHRIPASFYVSVAYNCWAYRRMAVDIDAGSGEITNWHYNDGEKIAFAQDDTNQNEANQTARTVELTTPISEEQIRDLNVGDVVKISGMMYTGRDAIHKYLSENDSPIDLDGQIIYHCWPSCDEK